MADIPMDPDWWPAISASLASPWPIGAVLFDLRWWAWQEANGGLQRPSRQHLQERWGWSGALWGEGVGSLAADDEG